MASLFRRIVVPHDFSTHADHALAVATELAAARRGRVVVLHVIVPYPATPLAVADPVPMIVPTELVKPTRERLEQAVRKRFPRRARMFDCRVVIGDPAQEIVDAGRRADSIVMSTAGRTGLAHLLIGSVAEKVVRHATCPVLTLRETAVRRRAKRRA